MYSSEIDNMVNALNKAGVITDNEKATEVLSDYWSDQIADVWHIQDVMDSMGKKYPQMTESDATEILFKVHNNMDAELGINWTTIECETDWHFDKTLDKLRG